MLHLFCYFIKQEDLMKGFDRFFLNVPYRLSNWTYKMIGLDNYMIATLILIASMGVSIWLGIGAHNLALKETNPEIARFRDTSALIGVAFSVTIAMLVLFTRRYIAETLTKRRDLDKKDRLAWGVSVFLRWLGIFLFVVSQPFQMHWYGMLDITLICIGGWFLACDPPDMNLRMNRVLGREL